MARGHAGDTLSTEKHKLVTLIRVTKNTFRAPTFSDSTHGGSTISRDIDPPGCHLRILDGETYFFVTPMVRLKLFSKCLGGRE